MSDYKRLQAGIEKYHEPKSEHDIDLVNLVRDELILVGLKLKVHEAFDTNQFIIEAIGRTSDVQRYLLNRYWQQQLITCSKPTTEQRGSLIPNGEINTWFTIFKEVILPFAIENDLPKRI